MAKQIAGRRFAPSRKSPPSALRLVWFPKQNHRRYTAWLKTMDSISYIYISWTIQGMWMIYITFERGGPKFSNTIASALNYSRAVQQRQLRAKWLLCSTRFFAFVSSLKLSRRLLCSVRFVFVSTFNLQPSNFIVSIIKCNLRYICH